MLPTGETHLASGAAEYPPLVAPAVEALTADPRGYPTAAEWAAAGADAPPASGSTVGVIGDSKPLAWAGGSSPLPDSAYPDQELGRPPNGLDSASRAAANGLFAASGRPSGALPLPSMQQQQQEQEHSRAPSLRGLKRRVRGAAMLRRSHSSMVGREASASTISTAPESVRDLFSNVLAGLKVLVSYVQVGVMRVGRVSGDNHGVGSRARV